MEPSGIIRYAHKSYNKRRGKQYQCICNDEITGSIDKRNTAGGLEAGITVIQQRSAHRQEAERSTREAEILPMQTRILRSIPGDGIIPYKNL